MVDPVWDFPLPEIGQRNWGDEVNAGLSNIPVGYGNVDGNLVFRLKSGEEIDLGPLPPGPQGAPGGSDEATAEWVETGPLTTNALDSQSALRLGRDPAMVQAGRLRVDAARAVPSLSQWLAAPSLAAAVLLGPSDSTGFSPNTVSGGPIGGVAGYLRQLDTLALALAAAYPDIRVELDVLDWINYGTGDQSAWVVGPDYPAYQDRRVLNAGSGEVYADLLGESGKYLFTPLTESNRLRDSEPVFFAADIAPTSWVPGSATNLLALSNGAGDHGVRLTLNTSGMLQLTISWDGTATANKTSTAAPVPDGDGRLYVGCLVEPDASGTQRYTFYTKPGGGSRTWTQLGTTITTSGAQTWRNPTGPWVIGAASNGGGAASQMLTGKVYEVQVRRGGLHGATMLPMLPSQWDWSVGQLDCLKGGPVLRLLNAARPGWGLDDYDSATVLPLAVPHLPYLAAVINTGHNDRKYYSRALTDKLDRLLARLERRTNGADVALLTQNPTLREDGIETNPLSRRFGTVARMSQMVAWARSRGVGVIDTYTAMTDYVDGCAAGTREPAAFKPDGTTPGDGTLSDLLDIAADPELGGQAGVHPKGYGVTLQAQKIYDEVTS